jgi:hypothetical protein
MNTRSILGLLIAGSIALGPASSGAAAVGPTASPDGPAVPPAFTDVQVAPEMMDPEFARGWVTMGVNRGLAEQPLDPKILDDRRLTVDLQGNVAAYRISVGLMRGGEWTGDLDQRECACTDDEMIDMVATMVAALAERLASETSVGTPATAGAPSTGSRPKPGRWRLGTLGKAGVGSTVLGAGLMGLGVAFLVVDRRPSGDAAADDRTGLDFTIPGAVSLGIGVVGLAAGVALLVIDKKRSRRRDRSNATMSWSPRGGVTFGMRF